MTKTHLTRARASSRKGSKQPRRIHRGVSYDAKARQWVITDEYIHGYVILARFDTSAEALSALKAMS